jgi:polyphosphate glucokinase
MKILVIDVGGTHVKLLVTGKRKHLQFDSGPRMTAKDMVADCQEGDGPKAGWKYDVVSMGYPGPVLHDHPMAEPHNLGPGWVGIQFPQGLRAARSKLSMTPPCRPWAATARGRMLFLGLGTGLGSALVVDSVVEPMELAHLPFKKAAPTRIFVGIKGLKRLGKKKWRKIRAGSGQAIARRDAGRVRRAGRRQRQADEETAALRTRAWATTTTPSAAASASGRKSKPRHEGDFLD